MKKHEDCEWMYNKYVCERLTILQIADVGKVHQDVVRHWLKKHKIHRKRLPRAQKRRRNKTAALQYKHNKCSICSYDKCWRALEFHHVDPPKKKFSISQGLEKDWTLLRKEIDKCILICKNCHTEAHNGFISEDLMRQILESDLKRNRTASNHESYKLS